MPRRPLPRTLPRTLALCAVLAVPVALAACVNEATPPPASPPIDYSAYSKLPLNVASIDIEQRYFASGQPPDVSADDPINPVSALRQMAQERLQAAGASGRAVFAIDNASVIEQDGELIGAASVTLSIIDTRGARVGYAQATATRQLVGFGTDLRGALYSLTSALVQQMNVEFENQVRRSLGPWLLSAAGAPPPVQAQPLTSPGGIPAPAPGALPVPTPYAPYAVSPYPVSPYPQTPSYQPGAPIPLTPPPYTPPPGQPSVAPPPSVALPQVTAPPIQPAPTPSPDQDQFQPAPSSTPPPIVQPSPPPAPPPPPAPAPASPPPTSPPGLPPLGPVVE